MLNKNSVTIPTNSYKLDTIKNSILPFFNYSVKIRENFDTE